MAMNTKKSRILIVGVVIVSAIAGFFIYKSIKVGGQIDEITTDLKDFGAAYQAATKQNGKPPASLADMKAFLEATSSRVQNRAGTEDIVVAWGAFIDPKVDRASERAFSMIRTKVGDKIVTMFQDGSIRHLTEEEVMKAPKVLPPVVPLPAKKDDKAGK